MSYTAGNNELTLFFLLREGLSVKGNRCEALSLFCSMPDWSWIYKMSAKQGVLAIVFDGMAKMIELNQINREYLPSKSLKLQWGYNVVQIEKRYALQQARAIELAALYAKQDIRTVVLKGLAVAQDFPKPNHRPCGDLDCFLMGKYEEGNHIVEELGVKVDCDFYKHSEFNFKGLNVENHQFCTPIRGRKKAKIFERALQDILREQQNQKIGDSDLEIPPVLFNALFLTIHAWGHFLSEGIALRHLVDWALLLEKHYEEIDWKTFKRLIIDRDEGMWRFAQMMTRLSVNYLSIRIDVEEFGDLSLRKIDERVLRDIFYDHVSVHNQPGGAWKHRFALIRNAFCSHWKYVSFSDESLVGHLFRTIRAFCFEKNPHL